MKILQKSLFVLSVILLALASTLGAQTAPDPDAPAAQAPTKETPAVSVDSGGLLLSTPDGSTKVRVHGYIQGDNRMFIENLHGEPLDQFLFRRIRPLIEGTLFNAIDFRFMPDFGQNNPQIQELFMEEKSLPYAKVRVGKFKEPIGLEVLKSDRELTFVERSLASDLVPLRYVGIQVGGSLVGDSINYAGGYFDGSNDGSNGNFQWTQSHEFAGRVFIQPFAKAQVKAAQGLGFGIAGSTGDLTGAVAGLKTVGQSTFFKFSSTAVADGRHDRVSPQAYFYYGPLGLMSEFAVSSLQMLNNGASRKLRNDAWEVAASWVVTGEKNSYSGIRPRHSFRPDKGWHYLGAFELATRYSELRVDAAAFPTFASANSSARQAAEVAIGANWYLNRFIKLVTDYEHTTFQMSPLATGTPLHAEKVVMSRIQLAF